MVFWSSFTKKVKQAVSQVSFDLLKNRVQAVEQTNQAQDTKINANTSNIAQLTTTTNQHTQSINTNNANINTLDNKVDSVITGLQNGNIVNYAGNWNSTTTFKLAQAVTYNGDWFVSNQDNNRNHQPSRTSSTYWVYISAPTVDLTPYLTIDNAISTYATINTVNGLDTRLLSAEQTLSTNSTNIVNLNNTKADKSYVDSLITYSTAYQLSSRLTWIKTKNENNRNWKWTGRLDNSIVPQKLINIEFELRGYDFSLTNQWYESIKYGWYKTPFYIIIWIESPDSQLDDYNLITRNTYIRFVSNR